MRASSRFTLFTAGWIAITGVHTIAHADTLDNVTITAVATLTSHASGPGTAASGEVTSAAFKAQIDLRGQTLTYTTPDGPFETRIDGTLATASAPARCNGQPTSVPRRWHTSAWFAGGRLIVVHNGDDVAFAAGPCRGATESVVETLAFKVENGTCTFWYTGGSKRTGINPISTTQTIVSQPCLVTPAAAPGTAQKPSNPQSSSATQSAQQNTAQLPPAPAEMPAACTAASGGSAQPVLATIPKCTPVYCAAETEVKWKDNLKRIDDMLTSLQVDIANTYAATQKFRRACVAVGGDFNAPGPKMDAFRSANYELSVYKGRITLLSEKIQKAPDEDMFSDTAAAMARTFKQPACMAQINQQTIDTLNAVDEAINKSIKSADDCAPSSAPK
jgi:hypothetical protein